MQGAAVSRIRSFYRDEKGTALIEFAIAFPVLLLLFYGAVELTRYMLFIEKLESAAIQVADIINQENEISVEDLDKLFAAMPDMMKPINNADLKPRVTIVERPRDPGGQRCKLRALWGYGPGSVRIRPNADDTLPEITVGEGDTVTVMELTGAYRPILDDAMQKRILRNVTGDVYVRVYSRPRYGAFRCNPMTRVCRSTPCVV